MSNQIHVTEVALKMGCRHTRYFVFSLDGAKIFDYRLRTSFTAFFHSKKKRNQTPDFLYRQVDLKHSMEETAMLEKYPDLYAQRLAVPTFLCSDLWDFYKLIGYDKKTKKFQRQ